MRCAHRTRARDPPRVKNWVRTPIFYGFGRFSGVGTRVHGNATEFFDRTFAGTWRGEDVYLARSRRRAGEVKSWRRSRRRPAPAGPHARVPPRVTQECRLACRLPPAAGRRGTCAPSRGSVATESSIIVSRLCISRVVHTFGDEPLGRPAHCVTPPLRRWSSPTALPLRTF